MKEQKEDKGIETMEIHPNHTTMWLGCALYKFITNDAWGIVVMGVLVRRNGARNEEINESYFA